MQQPFRNRWGFSESKGRLLLFLAMIVLVATVGPALGALECDDDSCRGTYDEIVSKLYARRDGMTAVFATSEAASFITSSSLACSRTYLVVAFANANEFDRDVAEEMMEQLQVAGAMGYEIEISWQQSNISGWMVCKAYTVSVYGPPASS